MTMTSERPRELSDATPNYVHIRVTYNVGDDYDVPATWALPSLIRDVLAPSVDDSGEIPVGEGDYDFPYREVTAFAWLTADELAAFRSEWVMEPEYAEPALGFLGAIEPDGLPRMYADERHSAEGHKFNIGGWTPVLFADVSIIGPDARPA